jgi:DNA invertase Pin-like site-specific DNA recombinase
MVGQDKGPSGRGAGYVRVSTEEQETARQHETISLWLKRRGLPADLEILEDRGRRHEPEKRKEFQRLLNMVRAKEVAWVVVDSQDRFGFGHPHQWGSFAWEFLQHEVQLWSATEDRNLVADDIGSVVISSVGAVGSRSEMIEKSRRDLGKKRTMARAGHYSGGWCPYGCDIVCLMPEGKERWRVITTGKWERLMVWPGGRTEERNGKNNFPQDRQQGDTLTLAPTLRTERIDILNDIFKWYVRENLTPNAIADRLGRLGIRHPHGPFYGVLIRGILRNPAAIGEPSWNKQGQGLFAELASDGSVTTDVPRLGPNQAKKSRRRPREQWIKPEKPLFAPLVPVDLYEAAAARLANSGFKGRSPRSSVLWLSGLVVCQRCGKPLTGWNTKDGPSYVCSEYRKSRHNTHGCKLHRIPQRVLEEHIDRWLGEIQEDITTARELGLDGLLTTTGDIRQRLARLVDQMERYLMEHLDQVASVTQLPDGRRRYELGGIVLDLPGCESRETLRETFSWLKSGRTRATRKRREELEKRLRGLVRNLTDLPDGLARKLCVEEIREVERQIESLDLGPTLSEQYNAALAELVKVARAIGRIRVESRVRQKSERLRVLLARIEVSYVYAQHGQQERSYWSELRFVPVDGSTERTFSNETSPALGSGRKVSEQVVACMLTRIYARLD